MQSEVKSLTITVKEKKGKRIESQKQTTSAASSRFLTTLQYKIQA